MFISNNIICIILLENIHIFSIYGYYIEKYKNIKYVSNNTIEWDANV